MKRFALAVLILCFTLPSFAASSKKPKPTPAPVLLTESDSDAEATEAGLTKADYMASVKEQLAELSNPAKLDWREEVRGINPLTTAACSAYDSFRSADLLRRELLERTGPDGDWDFTVADVGTSEAKLNELVAGAAKRMFVATWKALQANAPLPCFESSDENEHWAGMKQVGALALIYAVESLYEEGLAPKDIAELPGISPSAIRAALLTEAQKAGREDAALSKDRDPAKGEHAYCVSCFLNSDWGVPWEYLSEAAKQTCEIGVADIASANP